MTPIFIFSLPRSGSTLLQRILGSHDEIVTASEPWVLLPIFYIFRQEGVVSEYSHTTSYAAVNDLVSLLPKGELDMRNLINKFVRDLYGKLACNDEKYFLDKTPRYHLIAEEIIKTFPEAKFIYLWRNPLSIVASIVNGLNNGAWKMYNYDIDLFRGLNSLIESHKEHEGKSISVRYEDIVSSNSNSLQRIFKYLSIEIDKVEINKLGLAVLHGQMGDSTGVNEYSSVSDKSLEKWKNTLNTPIRRNWCERYIEWIGEDRLAYMGYSYTELISDMQSMDVTWRYTAGDLCNIMYGNVAKIIEPRLIKERLKKRKTEGRVYTFS